MDDGSDVQFKRPAGIPFSQQINPILRNTRGEFMQKMEVGQTDNGLPLLNPSQFTHELFQPLYFNDIHRTNSTEYTVHRV